MRRDGRSPGEKAGAAGVAAVALAIVCCAGAPLVVGLLGSVAIGTLVGAGVGTVALLAVLVAVVVRRRRTCDDPRRRKVEP
jgi:hypothetical protein